MSKRAWVGFFVCLSLIALGMNAVGEWVAWTAIVLMALGGIALTVRHEIMKHRVTNFLAEQREEDQDALLVWDEHWQDRPEIVARLGRRGPRVPLRGISEQFAYAPHHALMARVGLVCGVLTICLLVSIAVFAGPMERSERILMPFVLVFMVGITLVMPWSIRVATSRVVITDETITIVDRHGVETATQWSQIVAAKDSAINHVLMLRTADGRRIWVGHFIENYGRLANLVESRLPDHAAWRAQ